MEVEWSGSEGSEVIEVGPTNQTTPYLFLIITGYHARCLSLFLPTPLYIHAGTLLHTSVD